MGQAGRLCVLGALAALVAACATSESGHLVKAPPPPPAPPAERLAWMPLETRVSPEIAGAVNERLSHVEIEGITETFQAPVSMEMAQLAIECIERAPKCYGAVGRSVHADKLVWAELVRGGKRDPGVTLRVSMFDVERGVVVHQGQRAFPNVRAARDGAAALVDGTFAASAGEASP